MHKNITVYVLQQHYSRVRECCAFFVFQWFVCVFLLTLYFDWLCSAQLNQQCVCERASDVYWKHESMSESVCARVWKNVFLMYLSCSYIVLWRVCLSGPLFHVLFFCLSCDLSFSCSVFHLKTHLLSGMYLFRFILSFMVCDYYFHRQLAKSKQRIVTLR